MNFNTIGIICEYNPFHFGHKYHISKTREMTSCDSIVCIMSGSMVQRGECAVFDKWQRAKSAVLGGADLVIELPAYYALQSADNFAFGASYILNGLGIIDAISFGSEADDIDALKKLAEFMSDDNEQFNLSLQSEIKKGISYPKACQNALGFFMPDLAHILDNPNNTLGISYIRALNKMKSAITPLCIKRDNDYHSSKSNDEYMSASEIRSRIFEKSDYSKYSDDYSAENVYRLRNTESYILGTLRTLSEEYLLGVRGAEAGLANLIKNSAAKACTLEELIDLSSGKRYTNHRIKRYIMSAILGINYDAKPDYIRVLAVGKNGARLLKEIKQKSAFDIITKTADYTKKNPMFETDIRATDFSALCSDNVSERYMGKDYFKSPYIDKTNGD